MILGSILPDLHCVLHMGLDKLSYLFLVFTIGDVLGFASVGITERLFQPYPTLVLLTLLLSLELVAVSLVENVFVTAVCEFGFGFGASLSFGGK